jgi:hypothetical protein
MKKVCYKYKRISAGLFLAAYLILNAVNIIHYHNYDFQHGNQSFDISSEKVNHHGSAPFENTFCLIQYFVSSFHNVSNEVVKYSLKFDESKIPFPNSSRIIINSDYLGLNLLRAPPMIG